MVQIGLPSCEGQVSWWHRTAKVSSERERRSPPVASRPGADACGTSRPPGTSATSRRLAGLLVGAAIWAAAPVGAEIFEAESASLSGGVAAADDHRGYTGSGYADYPGTIGPDVKIQWRIERSRAGDFDIEVRYGNGGDADRSLELVVNGDAVATVAFEATAGGGGGLAGARQVSPASGSTPAGTRWSWSRATA